MKNSSRPRTAVEQQARRNYAVFCVASVLGMTACVAVLSYLVGS